MYDIPQQGEIQRVNTQQKKSDPEPTGNSIIPFQTYIIGNFLFPRLHEFIPSPFRVSNPDGSCRAETRSLNKK